MPIARFEMPDGKIARFEVAEGTTPEQAQEQIAAMLQSGERLESQQPAPQNSDMAFFETAAEPQPQPERTPGDVLQGIYETGRGIVQGAAGAPMYMMAAVDGIYKRFTDEGFSPEDAAKYANEAAAYFMTPPESETGKDIAEFMGDVGGALPPVLGVAPATIPAGSIKAATMGINDAAPAIKSQLAGEANEVLATVKNIPQALKRNEQTMPGSAGAARLSDARIRQERASELPVPMQLTKGQATQDMQQQKFEREVAKTEDGDALRANANLQNDQFNQNLDAMIDSTGTNLPDVALVETGQLVTKALENQVKSEKTKINKAYEAADKSKGAKEPVSLDSVGIFINDNMPSANYTGNILDAFQKETKRLGLAIGDMNNGNFSLGDMTVYQAEQLRKFVNANIDATNPKDQMIGSNLKKEIDTAVGDSGGEPYKRARRLRTEFSNKYQKKKLIKDLTSTKPGTNDRTVALENVVNKTVNLGSAEELINLRRTLQKTEEGKEAFKEVAAQVIKNIKLKAAGGVGKDENGNPLVSPAKLKQEIERLDQSGKLDILFGKKGAEDLRTIKDIAVDVFVSQPGAVNYSNTASTLATLLDAALLPITYSTTGLPMTGLATGVRASSKKLKQRKTKQRIKESLNFDARNQ